MVSDSSSTSSQPSGAPAPNAGGGVSSSAPAGSANSGASASVAKAGNAGGGASASASAAAKTKSKGTVSTMGATAIGLGGMMGAGLYTLLGLAATIAGQWVPLAFIIGGAVAAFSVYSYSKLGATFPSRGGAGEFLIKSFGDNTIAGGTNVFQLVGWVIAMALYAVGFGGYAADVLPWHMADWAPKAFGIGLVVVVVGINFIGSRWVSRSELFVVVIELIILAIFLFFAFWKADYTSFWHSFSTSGDHHWAGIFYAAGLLYVTYEGFGVVTNSAGDMRNPSKQLPRAMYTALIAVIAIYVAVSSAVVLVMSVSDMEKNAGHVLAEAAKAVMGKTGFILLGSAALLATASAVNATMFGDANLGFMMSTKRQLPAKVGKNIWRGGNVATLVVAALTIFFVAFFPLASVGQMASLAFLLIYAMVSVGHLRVRKQTGAKAWVLWTAIILNLGLFVLLMYYTISHKQTATWVTLLVVLALSFVVEYLYKKITGTHFRLRDFGRVHLHGPFHSKHGEHAKTGQHSA